MPTRLILMLAALTSWLTGCSPPLERFEFTRLCMGVPAGVVVYASDADAAKLAAAAAYNRLNELDASFSDYRQDSELMRLCRGPVGVPQAVSPDLLRVLIVADDVRKASDGAFDVTVGPAVRLWRDARRTGTLPADEAIARARASVGGEHIVIDPREGTVTLLRPGVQLDLGGIGKGYAAQAAVDLLIERGFPHCLVSLSGDVVAGRRPPGGRWVVSEAVRPGGGRQAILLENAAVSTSGDTQQYLQVDGIRYSHIIDPRSGRAVTSRHLATVIASRGEIADAVDSALCVLDESGGRRLVRSFDGTGAAVTTLRGGAETPLFSERAALFRPAPRQPADPVEPDGFRNDRPGPPGHGLPVQDSLPLGTLGPP